MWFYNTNILFIPHPTYSLTGDFFSKHPTHTLVNPLSNSPSKLSKNGLRWYVPMGWWNSDFEFLIFNLKIVEIAYLLHFPAFLLSCPRHQTYALNVGRVDRIDVFAIFAKWSYAGTYRLFCTFVGTYQYYSLFVTQLIVIQQILEDRILFNFVNLIFKNRLKLQVQIEHL